MGKKQIYHFLSEHGVE